MFKQDIIGELLYRGFVIEKGRCYQKIWSIGYKKTLKFHIKILSELLRLLSDKDDNIYLLMDEFCEFCNNKRIDKHYNVPDQFWLQIKSRNINWENRTYQYDKANRLMYLLIQELLSEINKLLVNKKKIYIIFRILHNLPRIYLGLNNDSILGLQQMGIFEKDAIQFAFSNMDSIHKEKYKEFVE